MTEAPRTGFAAMLLGRAQGQGTPFRPKLDVFDAPTPDRAPALVEEVEREIMAAPQPALQTPERLVTTLQPSLPTEAPRPAEPKLETRLEVGAPKAAQAPAPTAEPRPARAPVATPPVQQNREKARNEATAFVTAAAPPQPALATPKPESRASQPASLPPHPIAALTKAIQRLTASEPPKPAERLMPSAAKAELSMFPMSQPARGQEDRDEPAVAPMHIHIGEIVVAAEPTPMPPAPPRPRPAWSPALTLDAYRASRAKGVS